MGYGPHNDSVTLPYTPDKTEDFLFHIEADVLNYNNVWIAKFCKSVSNIICNEMLSNAT